MIFINKKLSANLITESFFVPRGTIILKVQMEEE